jgi:hypothetical protein
MKFTQMNFKLNQQVFFLVSSNVAMVPGILYCIITADMPTLAASLSVSALSSSFYHLCDMEYYCVFDLSFHSLQVMLHVFTWFV